MNFFEEIIGEELFGKGSKTSGSILIKTYFKDGYIYFVWKNPTGETYETRAKIDSLLKGYFPTWEELQEKYPDGSDVPLGSIALVRREKIGIYIYIYVLHYDGTKFWARDSNANHISLEELNEGVVLKSYPTLQPSNGDMRFVVKPSQIDIQNYFYDQFYQTGEWRKSGEISRSFHTDDFIIWDDSGVLAMDSQFAKKRLNIFRQASNADGQVFGDSSTKISAVLGEYLYKGYDSKESRMVEPLPKAELVSTEVKPYEKVEVIITWQTKKQVDDIKTPLKPVEKIISFTMKLDRAMKDAKAYLLIEDITDPISRKIYEPIGANMVDTQGFPVESDKPILSLDISQMVHLVEGRTYKFTGMMNKPYRMLGGLYNGSFKPYLSFDVLDLITEDILTDAPANGEMYARQNNEWVIVHNREWINRIRLNSEKIAINQKSIRELNNYKEVFKNDLRLTQIKQEIQKKSIFEINKKLME